MSETEIFEPCLVRKFKLGVEGGEGGGHGAPGPCFSIEISTNAMKLKFHPMIAPNKIRKLTNSPLWSCD